MSHQIKIIVTLHQNVVLDGDVGLASWETEKLVGSSPKPIAGLAQFAATQPPLAELPGVEGVEGALSASGTEAFFASTSEDRVVRLIRASAFGQRIVFWMPASEVEENFLTDLKRQVGDVIHARIAAGFLVVIAIPHNALAELSEYVVRKTTHPSQVAMGMDRLVNGLLGRDSSPGVRSFVTKALSARTATSHLSHDIHYYKAKFFPRMARALMNIMGAEMTGAPSVIDNFVGSGTTLLEARALGFESTGWDLDPLSVLISRAKLSVWDLESAPFHELATAICERLSNEHGSEQLALLSPGSDATRSFDFPKWLRKNRKMTPELEAMLNREISELRSAARGTPSEADNVVRVLISDAISRRLKFRFLGTGVGRFSLELAKTPMASQFKRNLLRFARKIAVAEWLKQRCLVKPGSATAEIGDARHPNADGLFDILLTSPPYLPASSGRESYAQARALSLLALDFFDPEELDHLVDGAVGSMAGLSSPHQDLAPDEQALVDWLANDELRSIKAVPTARYFADMRLTFRAMRGVLRPGAAAMMVSGKQSTFYEFASREPQYVVPAAALLAEQAEEAGFLVSQICDVQLLKSNMNARPRSLDDYFESVIVLQNGGKSLAGQRNHREPANA
jgi:hypothetical protein